MRSQPALESLRAEICQIEGQHRRAVPVLPFGVAWVDSRLPGGGLPRGALHEVAGGRQWRCGRRRCGAVSDDTELNLNSKHIFEFDAYECGGTIRDEIWQSDLERWFVPFLSALFDTRRGRTFARFMLRV